MIVMGPCEKILGPWIRRSRVSRNCCSWEGGGQRDSVKKKSWLSESRLCRDADIDNGKIQTDLVLCTWPDHPGQAPRQVFYIYRHFFEDVGSHLQSGIFFYSSLFIFWLYCASKGNLNSLTKDSLTREPESPAMTAWCLNHWITREVSLQSGFSEPLVLQGKAQIKQGTHLKRGTSAT